MKKTVVVRTILALVTIAALVPVLVTCEDMLFPRNVEGDEWTDVEYSPDGRSITVYLKPDGLGDDAVPGADTWGVPKTGEQRALTLELAKMGHDYFEAVFVAPGSPNSTIARAAWEIGTPAGISGVSRNVDYAAITGTEAAVIFVGKKTGKTLMGIGHIVKVDSTWVPAGTTATAVVTAGSRSVTFGVYPLLTQIGIENTATPPATPTWALKTLKTFLTDYGSGTISESLTLTNCQNIALQASVEYPLFKLPEVDTATWAGDPTGADLSAWPPILAEYTIGGLASNPTPNHPEFDGVLASKPDLLSAAILAGKLEVIKRTPSFLYKGQIFDAVGEVIDTYTKVVVTNNQVFATPTAFENPIKMTFRQHKQSTGIFAITFQAPVYAITANPVATTPPVSPTDPPVGEPINSTNGGPPATKWYIRPGYNQYQYLLDDGVAAGGAVMLGSGVAGLDWLDIFTVGVGFSN